MFNNPFNIPIWAKEIPDPEGSAAYFTKMARNLRDADKSGALLSGAWEDKARARSKGDYDAHGDSSFANHNLVRNPRFTMLHSVATDGVKEYLAGGAEEIPFTITNSWVSIYASGHWVPEHTHPLSHLSLVYYAAAPKRCGDIVFKNPAAPMFSGLYGGACNLFTQIYRIEPKEGMLIVFPSFIPHGTRPNESAQDRVIFSANVVLDNCPQLGNGGSSE